MIFKRPILAAPLLPASSDTSDETILAAMKKLRYPVLATLKKDGIRALRLNKSLLSRTLKEIPNIYIRERSLALPGGFDMELWNPLLSYDEIESIVMSRVHPRSDEIQFHVLDWFGAEGGYWKRCIAIGNKKVVNPAIDFIHPYECDCADTLLWYFQCAEQQEGEGICFRLPDSPYKQGRSTLREQYLVKLCRYVREEVTIIGVFEQMYNENSDSRNAVGMMDRSSCKDNLTGKDTLGGFLVQDRNKPCPIHIKGGTLEVQKCDYCGNLSDYATGYMTLRVGTGVGLTDKRRRELWLRWESLIGKTITIKHKPHGMKVKPRSPVVVGFRELGF